MQELPQAFVQQTRQLMGQDEAESLFSALDEESPTSIRFNKRKAQSLDLSSLSLGETVPWCPTANYLNERPLFTSDPLFHAGAYYVQEASSMLLYQIKNLLPQEPMTALDLCAAPGGKSTLLQDIIPEGSLLISNEVVPNRAKILLENMLKSGNPMSIVTSSMPDKWAKVKEAFDLILVDAPCSGEGMFRKEAKAREEWQAESPVICANRQQEILSHIYACLKPNGLLVYSTCTFNRLENEDIVTFIIEEFEVEPIELEALPTEVLRSPYSPYPCYRMQPNRLKGEGLFMAVFRKNGEAEKAHKPSAKTKGKRQNKQSNKQSLIPKEIGTFLQNPKDYHLHLEGDSLIYAQKALVVDYLNLLKTHKIAVLSAGIPVAEVKGKSLIPQPALALSTALSKDVFDAVELSQEECILYLARQNVQLPPNISKGIKLITYQGLGLGFVKHLGNRTNNLYPTEWRIRQWEQMLNGLSND